MAGKGTDRQRALPWLTALFLLSAPAWADSGTAPSRPAAQDDTFTFVRVEYDSAGGWGEARYSYEGRIWERWETDYPEAEENLIFRMRELTTLRVAPKPLTMRLDDPRIFSFPFVYMSDPGWQVLWKPEQDALREYLLRGGFLWADDFWGNAEWDNFAFNMALVFPDVKWVTIPSDHPILTIVYPLEQCPQVPAHIYAFRNPGQDWDSPSAHKGPPRVEELKQVNFRGLFLDGRLAAVATHNSDIADGWEREANDQRYFETYSLNAYAIAINIIVYAMTH